MPHTSASPTFLAYAVSSSGKPFVVGIVSGSVSGTRFQLEVRQSVSGMESQLSLYLRFVYVTPTPLPSFSYFPLCQTPVCASKAQPMLRVSGKLVVNHLSAYGYGLPVQLSDWLGEEGTQFVSKGDKKIAFGVRVW